MFVTSFVCKNFSSKPERFFHKPALRQAVLFKHKKKLASETSDQGSSTSFIAITVPKRESLVSYCYY